jgi:hypothetical protein
MSFLMDFIEYRIQKSTKLVNFNELSRKDERKDNRLRIVIDADTFLDRLYGGFHSNWLCGSDWITVSFYRDLVKTCFCNNIEIVLYFNGTNPKDLEIKEWEAREKDKFNSIETLFDNLIHDKDFPNKLLIKPVNLINHIIKEINSDTFNNCENLLHSFSTVKHHQKEILEFCQLNKCEYLLTNDSEILTLIYAQEIENIKLFSARSFKLTFEGNLLANQFDLALILRVFGIRPVHFPVLSTLLGNRFVNEKWFSKYFEKLHTMFDAELVSFLIVVFGIFLKFYL